MEEKKQMRKNVEQISNGYVSNIYRRNAKKKKY